MLPKGGYGAKGSTPFNLFRKGAEFFSENRSRKTLPAVEKNAARSEGLFREQVAPGIFVSVPGITKSGELLETAAERLYDFDVFDVWKVDGDRLVFAEGDTEDTMISNGVREWNAVVASRFGTEFYPLLLDLVMMKGPVTREDAVEYLQNIGETEWADYLLEEVTEDQWADILGSLSDIAPDEFQQTASKTAYQGVGQWATLSDPDMSEPKPTIESPKMDKPPMPAPAAPAPAKEPDKEPDKTPSKTKDKEEDKSKGDNPFGAPKKDDKKQDKKTDKTEDKEPDKKEASFFDDEMEQAYRLGYEYGSEPGAVELTTPEISERLSWDVLDAKPNSEGLFNAIGNVSAFQHGMRDALQGDSSKIDKMTGQTDMFREGKRAERVDEDSRLGPAGNRILSAFRDGTDMQVTERNPYGHEGFPSFVPRQSLYDLLILWSPSEIDADIEKGIELGYWTATRSGLKYKGGSKLAGLDTWEGESEEDSEPEEDQPQDDDITMTPSGPLGSRTSVGEINGKFLGEFDTRDEAEAFIKQYMQQSNWYPNVWWVSDHGNWNLVTLASKTADFDGIKNIEGDYTEAWRGDKTYKIPTIWLKGRVQALMAQNPSLAWPDAMGEAVNDWADQDDMSKNFLEEQGGPFGYRDTGMGYNAPVQIDPSAESHIGKLAGDGGFEEIPLDEWKGRMPDMGMSNEEIAQDFADYQNVNGGGGDVGQELKGFIQTNYPQQMNEFNAILGIYNQLAGNSKTADMSDEENVKILRDAFERGGPEFNATPGYDKSIMKYTGCSPEEVGFVESLMRDVYPTLDGIDSQQFSEVARESYELYKYVMGKTGQKTANAEETWIVVNANDFAEAERALAEGGFAGEKSRFVKQSGDSIVFALDTAGKTSDDIWRAMFGISWSFYNADSFGMSTYDKQAVRKRAVSIEDAPYDESKPWGGKPSRHVNYTEFGISDEDDIPEAWLMGGGRGGDIQDEVKYWFHQKWMEDGTARQLIEQGVAQVAEDGISLKTAEGEGATNEQIAEAWHDFMVSERGGAIGSPQAGLKLFIEYNYPNKLGEYEQILEIYENTQWPSSLVEGYPEALFPSD